MKSLGILGTFLGLIAIAVAGCSTKSRDVSNDIRNSLDQQKLQRVHVSQDRDKGVVTLTGQVGSSDEKSRAETIAKSIAAGQVVSDEVAVIPPGENDQKTVNGDLDKAIEKNLDAALIQNSLHKDVKYAVKNGDVTLKGTVNSESKRSEAQRIAASIPNVQQVVNELDVRHQKATSTNGANNGH